MIEEVLYGAEPASPPTIVSVQSVSLGGLTSRYLRGLNHFEERNFYQVDLLRGGGTCVMVLSDDVDSAFMQYAIRRAAGACGLAADEVHRRLRIVKVPTDGCTSLSRLLLEDFHAFAALKEALADLEGPVLDFWNVSEDEVALAAALRLPYLGLPPRMLEADSKSGSRALFESQGIPMPAGYRGIGNLREARASLRTLARETAAGSFLIKLDREEAGNGIARVRREMLDASEGEFIAGLEISKRIPVEAFLHQLGAQGCVVEEFIEAPFTAFPSVKMNVLPDGRVLNLATHDQVLSGMAYAGSRFPADAGYRKALIAFGRKIATAMSASGVRGIVSADFVATRDTPTGTWTLRGLEVNARKGATTHPYCWTRLLTASTYDADAGVLRTSEGPVAYRSSEYIQAPGLSRVDPSELIAALEEDGLDFDPATGSGVLVHMATTLRDFSKFGATFIGRGRQEVDRLHDRTAKLAQQLGARATRGREPLVLRS